MSSLNKVMLIGNLGRDPEMRYMPDGRAVANFTIATTEKWKDKTSGEPMERTEWHRIQAFDRLGEIAGEYLKKGSSVYVEGKLQTRKFQDKDGGDRYVTEVKASEIKFLGRAGGGDRERDEPSTQQSRPANKPASSSSKPPATKPTTTKTTGGLDEMPDDIPF